MKILLDANFVVSCIKQKIDFLSLTNKKFDEKIEFVLPVEVEDEIEKISKRKGEKTRDKEAAKVALEILRLIKPKKIKLGSGNVDDKIVDYALKNPEIVLATLDKELKKRVGGARILTIRGRGNLEVV